MTKILILEDDDFIRQQLAGILQEKGYLVVYNAFSLWHHYESKSRGYDDKNKEKMWRFNHEVEIFQKKWPEILKNGDPYYNRNFKIEKAPFTL